MASFTFGAGGNGTRLLQDGWGNPEPAFTWSTGPTSRLVLPVPQQPSPALYVEIAARALSTPGADGCRVEFFTGDQSRGVEFCTGEFVIGFRIPNPGGGELEISFRHLEPRSPRSVGTGEDDRLLSIALIAARVQRAQAAGAHGSQVVAPVAEAFTLPKHDLGRLVLERSGLVPEDFMLGYESLGLNCEFGLVQRAFGAEPVSLLRFAGLPYMQLLRGIEAQFAGLGSPGTLAETLPADASQLMIQAQDFDLVYHTFVEPGRFKPGELAAQHERIVAFRRRMLMELIAEPTKVFVVHRPQGLSPAQAFPLARALHLRGPSTLLYVCDRTDQPPGSVVVHNKRFLQACLSGTRVVGHSEMFNDRTWLTEQAIREWVSVLLNVHALRAGGRPG